MNQEDKTEIVKRLKTGILIRDYSGRLTYEIYDVPSELYPSMKNEIARKFRLFPLGITFHGLDASFQTFIKGRKRISIEWDIWSGLIIVAKNNRAESLVHEISQYLEDTAGA